MSRPDSPALVALLIYLGLTVVVPWLNGARGPRFGEHAMTVLAAAALLGLARRAWASRGSRRRAAARSS